MVVIRMRVMAVGFSGMGVVMTIVVSVVVMDMVSNWGVVEWDGVSELDSHVCVYGFAIYKDLEIRGN
jgi:hypothetical protein